MIATLFINFFTMCKTQSRYTIKGIYKVLSNFNLDKQKRIYLNSKALNMQNLEVAYNSFTGKGGLHSIKRRNYKTYYDYADKKQEIEM